MSAGQYVAGVGPTQGGGLTAQARLLGWPGAGLTLSTGQKKAKKYRLFFNDSTLTIWEAILY